MLVGVLAQCARGAFTPSASWNNDASTKPSVFTPTESWPLNPKTKPKGPTETKEWPYPPERKSWTQTYPSIAKDTTNPTEQPETSACTDTTSSDTPGSSKTGIIVGCTVGGIVVIAAIVFLVFTLRRNRQRNMELYTIPIIKEDLLDPKERGTENNA